MCLVFCLFVPSLMVAWAMEFNSEALLNMPMITVSILDTRAHVRIHCWQVSGVAHRHADLDSHLVEKIMHGIDLPSTTLYNTSFLFDGVRNQERREAIGNLFSPI